MHTLMVIAGGLILLAGLVLGGRAVGAPLVTLQLFLPIWLIVTVANLWIGVDHAGYSFARELPIALVVFAVPALPAFLLLRILRS